MLTPKSAIFCGGTGNASPYPFLNKRSRDCSTVVALAQKKNHSSENRPTTQQQPSLPLKISTKFLAQSATGVFALGFVDAGYSGDWSRIGVISKETEDLLKVAAFFVVPFCLFLVFWLSREPDR